MPPPEPDYIRPELSYIRQAILEEDIDQSILAWILETLDELKEARLALKKVSSALETNPITGDRTAWAVLKAHKERWPGSQ